MREAQADVLGAMLVVLVLLASSMALFLALGTYFRCASAYDGALALASHYGKQNVSVAYVQALPPDGQPGLVVVNYGEPVEIVYLVEELSNGSLSLVPESINLQHGQHAFLLTDDPDSGVMTSLGALFMANCSSPLVPVSFTAINVSARTPSGLYFVSPGYYSFTTGAPAKWFVNGTFYNSGRTFEESLRLYIDGPTTITAVPVSSHP
ncbi:MAG: hypothetical protein ACP5GH_06650 [Nitrososphaeria archaeon]